MGDSNILVEAINLGRQIVRAAKKDINGYYWEFHNSDGTLSIHSNLYNGNAGVIVFLCDLYQFSPEKQFFNTIAKACQWLIQAHHTYKQEPLSFFTGNGGIVYALLKGESITNDTTIKDFCLQLVKENLHLKRNNPFDWNFYRNDLLAGKAGTILSLLKYYDLTKEEWVINDIYIETISLLQSLELTPKGVCWDKNGESILPLCGFAHGASGFGFIFNELSKIFDDDFLHRLAHSCFEYEDQFYSAEHCNWPDFRKDVFSQDAIDLLQTALENNDEGKFVEYGYMNAWCHGAPGIGMARLNDYIATGDELCLIYYKRALGNLHYAYNNPAFYSNNCLCHGTLGLTELAIQSYAHFKKIELLDFSKKVANKCIANKQESGFYKSGYPNVKEPADCSLFIGLAGIGHEFLRILEPVKIDSVLVPIISEIDCKRKTDFKYVVFQILMAKYFGNVNNVKPIQYDSSIDILNRNALIEYVTLFEKDDKNQYLQYLQIDRLKFNLFDKMQNDLLLRIKNERNQIKLQQLHLADFDDFGNSVKYILSPFIDLCCIDSQYFVLTQNCNEPTIQQYQVGYFIFLILESFNKFDTAEDSFNYIKVSFIFDSQNEPYIKSEYLRQLRNCLELNFLFVA